MNEHNNTLDTLLNVITLGFVALGIYAIVDSFRRGDDESEPEYILTSRGRKLYISYLVRDGENRVAAVGQPIPINREQTERAPEPTASEQP